MDKISISNKTGQNEWRRQKERKTEIELDTLPDKVRIEWFEGENINEASETMLSIHSRTIDL